MRIASKIHRPIVRIASTPIPRVVSAGVPIETALDKIMGWDAEDMDEMAAQQQAAFLVGNEQ